MRYFTSDTHFGHPLVTALRGFLNNGKLRAEYLDIWQTQTRTAAHAWIKQLCARQSDIVQSDLRHRTS